MEKIKFGGIFDTRCFDKSRELKWEDRMKNTVVDEGLQHMLDVTFTTGTSKEMKWYVALLSTSTGIGSSDTMTGAGFSESTGYTGSRKEFIDVRSTNSVDNSGSVASFTINTASTIMGAALVSASSGAGTLLCGASFTGGNRAVSTGDTVEVTYTFTAVGT